MQIFLIRLLFPKLLALSAVCSLCLLCSVCLLTGCRQETESPEKKEDISADKLDASKLLSSGQKQIQRGNYHQASEYLRQYLLLVPDDLNALELIGDTFVGLSDFDLASEQYKAVLGKTASPSERFLNKYATTLIKASRAFDCLEVLSDRAKRFPDYPNAGAEMVGLAASLGVAEQGLAALRNLSMKGGADAESLQVLADPLRVEPDYEWCESLLKKQPDDIRPLYASARKDADKFAWPAVRSCLEAVVQAHPEFVPAQTLYGLALVKTDDFASLYEWNKGLPKEADSDPRYWMVSGLWAENGKHYDQAARAYYEAIRLDPLGYPDAVPNLLLCLKKIGRLRDFETVAAYLNKVTFLRDNIKEFFERSSNSQAAAFRVADAMLSLGRLWEAEGWARFALSLTDDLVVEQRDRYLTIRAQLKATTPWQLESDLLSNQIDLRDLPSVAWMISEKKIGKSDLQLDSELRLVDEAVERGLLHQCQLKKSQDPSGHWIYQTLGGGAGVIDYDLDGWSDLALAVLDGTPLQQDSSTNRMMRNEGGHFSEVTSAVAYLDSGFGQGVSVSDYNNDGFPDVLDCNIGLNRLFRNNGDGTFTDVTAVSGLSAELWTTCSVIADIDGDGLSDIYEVTYCGGHQPYETECRNQHGLATCAPLKFDAEVDHFWRGAADGSFVNATESWAGKTSHGRGLGIVAGEFDEYLGLDLLVANDMTANQFWSSRSSQDQFKIVDIASLCGVGVSGRSLSQASMGIAVADPDSDGDFDFFLTHFADDHNTYYEQAAPGLWSDRTAQRGLAQPSYTMLGFGTQWLDLNSDGNLELFVANGHVDRVDDDRVPFEMPAQIFELNAEDQYWNQVDASKFGEYFLSDHVGRVVISVDADRNGLIDIGVTHLYEPMSLLVNHTDQVGNRLVLDLKSTNGHRDAIGAVVQVIAGERSAFSQVTAGDGFMCSQDHRLFFGAVATDQPRDVLVTWPSGEVESFAGTTFGNEYLLVEGSGEAFLRESYGVSE